MGKRIELTRQTLQRKGRIIACTNEKPQYDNNHGSATAINTIRKAFELVYTKTALIIPLSGMGPHDF